MATSRRSPVDRNKVWPHFGPMTYEEHMRTEIKLAEEKLHSLQDSLEKARLAQGFSYDRFKSSPAKMAYYTGDEDMLADML